MDIVRIMSSARTIYFGTFVHSASLKELAVISDGMLGVDGEGVICFVERGEAVQGYLSSGDQDGLGQVAREWIGGVGDGKTVLRLGRSRQGAVTFWYPGFVGKG